MLYTFNVSRSVRELSRKLGVEATGLLRNVVYDRQRESVVFVVENFSGDVEKFRQALSSFLGVHVDIVLEATSSPLDGRNVDDPEAVKKYVVDLLNGTGKYVERVELTGDRAVIYVLGEFAKNHVEMRLRRLKTKLPFARYEIETLNPEDDVHSASLDGAERSGQQVGALQLSTGAPTSRPEELRRPPSPATQPDDETRPERSQLELREQLKRMYSPSNLPTPKKRAKMYGKVFKIDAPTDDVLNVYVTDKRDSIVCKIFNSKTKTLREKIQEGNWYVFTGVVDYDRSGVSFFKVDAVSELESLDRVDNAAVKRVELHAHTKMSDLDSVMSVEEYVRTAKRWGWDAVAVTDHGNVQSIPEFFEVATLNGVKPIFGAELYIAHDPKKILVGTADAEIDDATFVVIDLETTGLNPRVDEVMEIGAVKTRNGEVIEEFHTFVRPKVLKDKSLEITGITAEMLRDAPEFESVAERLLNFLEGTVLVAHNADFDMTFLKNAYARLGVDFNPPYVDTLRLASALLRNRLRSFSLDRLAELFGLGPFQHHRALDDAKMTTNVFWKLVELARKKSITSLDRLNKLVENINPLSKHPRHVTVLVQNRIGLRNLYQLISKSHTETFFVVPQVLRSDLEAHREGLLVGSGCPNSEIFELALRGDRGALLEALKFYDYVEVVPLDTIVSDEFSVDDAREAYKLLYQVARELNIPVVMVSNAHFLDPEDKKARKVLLAPQGNVNDAEANYCLRTTDEMIQCAFEIFRDESVAFEVAVENPRRISTLIEVVKPVEKKLHPPKIEGADEKLREMTYKRALELYGEPLPELVEKRIVRELSSIIGHGYAVLYMIAHLIVKKASEDGYVVGSRGSVGSSLVAHLVGITEVNPLPPHYRCPECKYVEFHEEYGSGYDLPSKLCPRCGARLAKAGQDIPFEVFMGFEGDKVPDIDLNFSGEYQDRAHRFIEELFGKNRVFRAGTISTIADRSAIGFVKSFMEDRNGNVVNPLHPAEQERLATYVTGVKRTTGQHPGGLMIVPGDRDIHDFTPYQYPANDRKAGVFTTHFAYESIHDDLVKLDALGHDDPTMIKLLHEYSGVDPMTVPMDDKDTMSIFSSVRVLKVDPAELGTDVGTIGIPEFGTDFVMGMLKETRPKTFAELVRISGLSHGTDVWLGNAQTLIQKKIASLSEVISCRDDIMLYLIHKGVPAASAFKIMENVRKGKGLREEEVQLMKEYGVPDWFIESCQKIKYLFPKAHAVAYVSMAFRIAYFKVHYPLAFYAAFFTTKGDEFDAEFVLRGKEAIRSRLAELGGNLKKDVKEKNEEKVLQAALEMLLRGFGFKKPDLSRSHSSKFIIDGKDLLIPFNKIRGIGDNVARDIVEKRSERVFTSVEDLKNRVRITNAQLDTLRRIGVLNGLPETDQATLF